jgi:hypothetical protein
MMEHITLGTRRQRWPAEKTSDEERVNKRQKDPGVIIIIIIIIIITEVWRHKGRNRTYKSDRSRPSNQQKLF